MSQKIAEQIWPAGTRPVVSVCCTTYNHKKYIAECLDGILMQETTFPVEIIIHDDASTDSTPGIIEAYHQRYPHVIRLIRQPVNQRSQGHKILQLVFPKTRGEFFAICEGDDFWSDPRKLQTQYQLLRESPEVQACFHDCVSIKKEDDLWKVKDQITWSADEVRTQDLLDGNPAMTCSAFLRSTAFPKMPEIFRELKMGDLPLWILYSLKGRILWIHKNMGTYRLHDSGSWSNKPQSEMHLGILECIAKMGDLLPASLKQMHQVFLARHMARYAVHLDKEMQDNPASVMPNYPTVNINFSEEECGGEFCEEYLRRATWLFEHHDERILAQLEEYLKTQGCPPSKATSLASIHFGNYFPNQLIPENKTQKRLSRVWDFLKFCR
jgi:glycosyltransferase involved in cell wall biosynthesis